MAQDEQEQTADDLPEMDFTMFVMSLATNALMAMGEVPDEQGHRYSNLPLAKQSIDILTMLQEKTTGNLSDEEARLLEQHLFELRMRFVEKSKESGS